MLKVLDLFAGTQSVRKALTEKYGIEKWYYEDNRWTGWKFNSETQEMDLMVEYIGIDIYSPEEENIIFDLTQDDVFDRLTEVLPKSWTPDFIWASPVCNKFSRAVTGTGGNMYFKIWRDSIRPRIAHEYNEVKHNKVNLKPEKWSGYEKEAWLALKMFNNTKSIISHFKVPFAIENPRTALSKYILDEFAANYTNYCMYDKSFSKKPTTIYSSMKLNLLKCDHKGKHVNTIEGSICAYANRSRVPQKLIISVIEQSTGDE